MNDKEFMIEAFKEAVAAYERGECPVGAVLVKDGQIISRAGNEELARCDPTAHAEILCLRRAGKILKRHVFHDCTIYTTLWPCPMCDKALLQARVPRVVSGAQTFKWVAETRFNKDNLHREGPIMNEECRSIFIDWLKKNERYEILDREGI
jgi:tRNA(adenine34) deaminase